MRSKNQALILRVLQESGKELTTKQLQSELNISYDVLTRHLRTLTDKKAVIRRFKDKGFAYKFKRWPDEEREFEPLKADELRGLINGSVTKGLWKPTIAKPETYNILPTTLIGLNLLVVQLSQGDQINQKDLDSLKSELRFMLQKVEGVRNVLGRLLSTDDVWDKNSLGGFFSV